MQFSEENQYLLVNTSSPDRCMDVLPELFKKVKEQVPEARLKWAYGWDIFNNSYSDNDKMMAWRDDIKNKIKDSTKKGEQLLLQVIDIIQRDKKENKPNLELFQNDMINTLKEIINEQENKNNLLIKNENLESSNISTLTNFSSNIHSLRHFI